MTPIVLVGPGNDIVQAQKIMAHRRPHLIFCRPEDSLAQYAEVAVCWAPPDGSLGTLPNLKLIHSVGAGAERIFSEPSRPAHIPVCRIVDPGHCQGMLEYVLWGVMHYHRRFDQMIANQSTQTWQRLPQRPARDTKVGIMGLGQLGKAVAVQLAQLGFNTRGWARNEQAIEQVQTFTTNQLPIFLEGLDILICLLPLTEHTRGILCAESFGSLAKGAAVINCGRGDHLCEDHLVDALTSGQLRGALLDVFSQEPLALHHPLWNTPGVIVTPHIASSASFEIIGEQILANIDRLHAGMPLLNTVDAIRGY
ncbi:MULTISPECIES: 2-hydroxyacid dehydrogenase [unclassified Pseudomonas]|uniref:2-hydroxyacid dehydrogenase n=1 Tax=unclassified Pseudomonas TaxID=196821 RepID=UPI0025E2A173|nr:MULTISPECIES: glyoxylate/hydroxypyruvate reductase A [unclassified Pseudomonas]